MNDITRETKGQAKRKKHGSEWQEPVTSPTQTLTQGGHEIASLLNQNEQNLFIFTYDETNKQKLGEKIKHPIKGRLPDEV